MRISLHLRLAATFVMTTLLSLAVAGALSEHRIAGEIQSETAHRLQQEGRLLGAELDARSLANEESNQWAHERGALLHERVTLIAPDGRVLGDSELDAAAVRNVENHGDRPEVLDAHRLGVGEARRRSATLGKDMLYVAASYSRGTVRVSIPLDRVAVAIADVRFQHRRSAWARADGIARHRLCGRAPGEPPDPAITRRALEMAQGRFEGRLARKTDDELRDLSEAMNQLASNLDLYVTSLREEGARCAQSSTAWPRGHGHRRRRPYRAVE